MIIREANSSLSLRIYTKILNKNKILISESELNKTTKTQNEQIAPRP